MDDRDDNSQWQFEQQQEQEWEIAFGTAAEDMIKFAAQHEKENKNAVQR